VNVVLSMAAVYAMVYIMMSDIAGASEQEMELRKGIANREFFLVYQAQVASSGRVLGAEALLRWKHPKRGLVSPVEFIGPAEETGLILPLGLLALDMACQELVAWSQRADMAELTLSVNVSVQQFHEPDFVNAVKAVMERHGVRPNRLKLELTESLLANDLDDIVAKMEALKALGVGFSLDDFGTGYSSLNYLKRLPLDQLKIDQSFVRDVLTDPNGAAIARTVITLGQSMGFAVIAEGVETLGQRDFLMANGCHLFQGYLFARPLTARHFTEFVLQPPEYVAQPQG
jgi:EAL domain-containing protein (putative c-di-GMP-specific phosphodiesterase class I)